MKHISILCGGWHRFQTPSSDDRTVYTQQINVLDGQCSCSCHDFAYRHANKDARIYRVGSYCKHIYPCIEHLLNLGELEAESLVIDTFTYSRRICVKCRCDGAEMSLCDRQGQPVNGYLCGRCFQAMQHVGPEEARMLAHVAELKQKRDLLKADKLVWPDLDGLDIELQRVENEIERVLRARVEVE